MSVAVATFVPKDALVLSELIDQLAGLGSHLRIGFNNEFEFADSGKSALTII